MIRQFKRHNVVLIFSNLQVMAMSELVTFLLIQICRNSYTSMLNKQVELFLIITVLFFPQPSVLEILLKAALEDMKYTEDVEEALQQLESGNVLDD